MPEIFCHECTRMGTNGFLPRMDGMNTDKVKRLCTFVCHRATEFTENNNQQPKTNDQRPTTNNCQLITTN